MILLVLLSANLEGQVRIRGGRAYASVDPNDQVQLFRLLANAQVQIELGLSVTQRESYATVISRQRSEYARLPGNARIQTRKKHENEASEVLEELLLPEQISRLKQLAFRIEIATIGFGEALTRGFLSQEVAVQPEQITDILKLCRVATEEFNQQRISIHEDAEIELAAGLAPDQRAAFEAALGAPWIYETISEKQIAYRHELEVEAAKKKGSDPPPPLSTRVVAGVSNKIGSDLIFVTGNPNFAADVFTALLDAQVQRELKLTTEQLDSIERLTREKEVDLFGFSAALPASIEELLTEAQHARVKQLMYRIEIANAGIAHALTLGRLSLACNVHVQQREQIRRNARSIEAKKRQLLKSAKRAVEKGVESGLEKTQRSSLRSALGDVFLYETISLTQESLFRELAKRKLDLDLTSAANQD